LQNVVDKYRTWDYDDECRQCDYKREERRADVVWKNDEIKKSGLKKRREVAEFGLLSYGFLER